MRPTSSLPVTATRSQPRLAPDPRDDLVRRRGFPVLDVHRHLHEPGGREIEPERTDALESAVDLSHDRGDLARDLDRRRGG